MKLVLLLFVNFISQAYQVYSQLSITDYRLFTMLRHFYGNILIDLFNEEKLLFFSSKMWHSSFINNIYICWFIGQNIPNAFIMNHFFHWSVEKSSFATSEFRFGSSLFRMPPKIVIMIKHVTQLNCFWKMPFFKLFHYYYNYNCCEKRHSTNDKNYENKSFTRI